MNSLIQRMKSWFGGNRRPGDVPPPAGRRCALGPPDSSEVLSLDASTAVAASAASSRTTESERLELNESSRLPSQAPVLAATSRGATAEESGGNGFDPLAPGADSPSAPARLDPLDPAWMKSFETLPARLTESAAHAAAGARSLENIGAELEGHRLATRTIADSVRRLPDMAAHQADLARQANKTLERQALVLESTLDGITDLRAAFRSVEESSRRHLKAIAQLEYGHRQILFEYQEMLLKVQRRLARLAFLGVILGALALAGVGFALFRLAVATQ
jgi:hypothetical protein